MLRSEKSNQFHLVGLVQYIYGTAQLRVDPGRISHKTDPLALESVEFVFDQDFKPGFDLRGGVEADGGAEKAAKQRDDCRKEYFISYHIVNQFFS